MSAEWRVIKKILLVALIVVSVWGSERSQAKQGSSERTQLQQESRLPSPQRGRGAGGEGDRHNGIGSFAFGMPQASSAFMAERPGGATLSHTQVQAKSRRREGFLPGAR